MNCNSEEIIIYSTADGKANISLLAKDGSVWLNQNQLAELFATSKANISTHISNIFEDKELQENSVVKFYLTTAAVVLFYAKTKKWAPGKKKPLRPVPRIPKKISL